MIDHPNMFVYGSQPLGGWNDNLDVATANHFSNASMRPRTCARKKLGSGGGLIIAGGKILLKFEVTV